MVRLEKRCTLSQNPNLALRKTKISLSAISEPLQKRDLRAWERERELTDSVQIPQADQNREVSPCSAEARVAKIPEIVVLGCAVHFVRNNVRDLFEEQRTKQQNKALDRHLQIWLAKTPDD